MFMQFVGASFTVEMGKPEYHKKGLVYVNPDLVSGFCDHLILIHGNKIHVMETAKEICNKMEEHGKTVYR